MDSMISFFSLLSDIYLFIARKILGHKMLRFYNGNTQHSRAKHAEIHERDLKKAAFSYSILP